MSTRFEVNKKSKTVLLTSAGTATALNVLSSLRSSSVYDVKTIAVDRSKDAVGLYLADKFRLVPGSDDAGYLNCIAQVAYEEGVDFIFPLHSSEIVKFAEQSEMFRSRGVELTVPSPRVVTVCNDKQAFQEFLLANSFDHPRWLSSPAAVKSFPVFIKPRWGSSSVGSYRVDSREELDFLCRRNPNSVIQEWVGWPEITVDCYVNRSGALVACVPRHRVKVKDGKSVVSRTLDNSHITRVVDALLQRLTLVGPCNVQLFSDGKESIKFIEVNPRLAAGGLPLATKVGVNIPELMLRDADGSLSNERLPTKPGVTMLRYLTEVYISG